MAVENIRNEPGPTISDKERRTGAAVTRRNEGIPEKLDNQEPLRRQCQQFLESIRTRQRPLTDGESGLRVLRVLDAAERSLAERGKPTSL